MSNAALLAAQRGVSVCMNAASGCFLILDTNRRADVVLDIVNLISVSLLVIYQNCMLSVAQSLRIIFLDHKQFGRKRHVGNAST